MIRSEKGYCLRANADSWSGLGITPHPFQYLPFRALRPVQNTALSNLINDPSVRYDNIDVFVMRLHRHLREHLLIKR